MENTGTPSLKLKSSPNIKYYMVENNYIVERLVCYRYLLRGTNKCNVHFEMSAMCTWERPLKFFRVKFCSESKYRVQTSEFRRALTKIASISSSMHSPAALEYLVLIVKIGIKLDNFSVSVQNKSV